MMAGFTIKDLKKWRIEQCISADCLASCIHVDPSTYYRYENGTVKPDPDVMYRICHELGDVGRWMDWMRSEYPESYGKVHPAALGHDLKGAIMQVFAEISDMTDLEKRTMHDGADGRIDNPQLNTELTIEVTELIQAAQRLKEHLERR